MPRRAASRSDGSTGGTRERIISAAIDLLRERGVAGVTTRRVAEEAQVNPALVHYYFDSVDSLMLEVVERIARGHIERHETTYSDADDFFATWKQDMADLLAEDPQEGNIKVWYEAMAVVWNSPVMSQRYGSLHRARSRQVIKSAIVRQMAATSSAQGRRLDSDAAADDADALAVLISVVRSGLSLDRLLGFDEGHERAVALLAELLAAHLSATPVVAPGTDPPASGEAADAKDTGPASARGKAGSRPARKR